MRACLACGLLAVAAALQQPAAVARGAAQRSGARSAVQMGPAEQSLVSRRDAFACLAAAAVGVAAQPALAVDEKDYKLKKDYPVDARTMLKNMVIATDMARGTPGMESTVKATRSEMNDFVAFYRRQPKVAGMPSFSTMYTAINTLSGHYASYGNKYPVPEKRKVRLQQQYKEIERALARGK